MASPWNRREVLASFLGAPLALAAGCNSEPPPELKGELIGPGVGIGHRLRDGFRPWPADDAWQQASVVIVGGGIAGLSAAWRLRRAGVEDFVLLELEEAPGGTSRSGESPLCGFPWGAHYLPAPMSENQILLDLLAEMDVLEGTDDVGQPIIAEQFLCRDPQERVFYRGRWYEGLYLHAGASERDLAQLAEFEASVDRWVGWRDETGRRAFTIPVASCSDDPKVRELDRMTMGHWLARQGFDSPRLRWLVDYSCRDDYGMSVDQTSAWAGLFYFASRVRTVGSEPQPLITWPEGNGRLVSHLTSTVREHVRLGRVVSQIMPQHGERPSVRIVTCAHSGKQVEGWEAERVIFAAPRFLAPHLITDFPTDAREDAATFHYGSWLVANLHLHDRPESLGFPLCWDNVLYESPSLGYVTATHQKGIDRGPTVLTYYYPLCDADPTKARQRLLELDWESCADIVLSDLSRAHPELPRLTDRLDVMRWGHAMIQPRPGFVCGAARKRAQQPFRSIHFAHSDLSGIALFEEAFYHGTRAADEVLAFRKK